MIERKITFLGKELKIAFNMKVQLSYEDILDEPFDVLKVGSTRKSQMALYTAAIIANNPDTDITAEDIITKADNKEFTTLDKAIAECMEDFYGIPKVAESHVRETAHEAEDIEKN